MNKLIFIIISALIVLLSPIAFQESDASSDPLSIGLYQEGMPDTPLSGPLIDSIMLVNTETTPSGISYKVPAGTILSQNRGYLKVNGDITTCSLEVSIPSSSIAGSMIGQTGLRIALSSDSGTSEIILDHTNGFSSGISSIIIGTPYHITVTTATAYSSGIAPSDNVRMDITFSVSSSDIIPISFDPNGGTTDISSKNVIVGGIYGDLPIPTRSGHIFDGWFTQPSGGDGITYSTIVTQASDHTLYAHWTKVVTVTFDPNGGSFPTPASKEVLVGGGYGELPVITREHHSFDGWFTDDGAKVTSDSTVAIQNDHTLHAQWTPGKLIVNFDMNGSQSQSPSSREFTYGTEYSGLLTPERYGYTFDGWFTSPEGGTEVSDGDDVDRTGSITLYAHWIPKVITVSFDTAGGTQVQSVRITFGDTYGNLPVTTKEGYNLSGWYLPDGSSVSGSTEVTIGEDHTLTAHWTPRTYTVTFDVAGGSQTSPVSIDVTFGQPYGTLPITSKNGSVFSGWYTFDGTLITESTIVSISQDHTLIAHWNPKTVTVTFDPNGGSAEEMTKVVTVGGKYGKLPTASKMGHTFSGWYTSPEGGTRVVPGTDVIQTTDHTLYAHWSKNTPVDPSPTPKPEPKPPEYHESEVIEDDGSRTETSKTVTKDGNITITEEKEVNTGLNGSTSTKETTSVSEKTSSGSVTEISSKTVMRDSKGNIIGTSETNGTVTVDGDLTTSSLTTVNRDGKDNILSEDKIERTEISKDGTIETTETTVSVGPDGTIITEISTISKDNEGSLEKTVDRKVTYLDTSGKTVSVESSESEIRETGISGGITKVTTSVNTITGSDGNIIFSQEVRSEVTNRMDGDTSIVSSSVITVSKDAGGNIISTVKDDSETVRSPGSDIVTTFRTETDSSLGNRIEEGIRSSDPTYSVTTVASKVTFDDNVVIGVHTTLNYLDEPHLDSDDVDIAYQHSVRTTYGTEFELSDRFVRVEANNTVTIATQSAFMNMSEKGIGLYVKGPEGSLTYDADSCRTFASIGGDVKVSMDIGGDLTEEQRKVIGGNHYITISAISGDVYISDIGGKVTMTFAFDIGEGRFRACYIADDGSMEEMPWSYDYHTGKVSIESGHHSVYAMIPVDDPEEGGFPILSLMAIILALLVASILFIFIRRRS